MSVLLIGTLDTKSAEIHFLKNRIESAQISCLVLDAGILGESPHPADISREDVCRAAGTSLSELQRRADRGKAVDSSMKGVCAIVQRLYQAGTIEGVIGIGGSAGTAIATAAMRALPLGVPKIMVSTLASGQVQPYVGVSDIMMVHSVVDFCGINRISATVLSNAAAAMIGMIQARGDILQFANSYTKPLITATMFGVTTPCVERCRSLLNQLDYEVLVFHATGTGGKTMESLIRNRMIRGVLDLTTTELADELVGGILSAGPDRLTAAASTGTPQVISLGALDMVNFGPLETVPPKYQSRRLYQHNSNVTLMRTTPEENDLLGKQIAEKACASQGPTAILVPLKGLSAIDREGGSFWWPEADQALFQSLRNWLNSDVELIECDLHINDPEFAEIAVSTLKRLMANG